MTKDIRCERCGSGLRLNFSVGNKFRCIHCKNIIEYIGYEEVSDLKTKEVCKIPIGFIGRQNKLKRWKKR